MVTGEKRSLMNIAKEWLTSSNISPMSLMTTNRTVSGFHLGKVTDHERIRRVMVELLSLFEAGKIEPIIHKVFTFENMTDAMKEIHERKNIGKVLLTPHEISE